MSNLQTSVGIRFTVVGDGVSDTLRIDLHNTLVILGGKYVTLPRTPAPSSVLAVRIGGPNINPEDSLFSRFVLKSDIKDGVLSLKFAVPLIENREDYTIEVILGYDSLPKESDVSTEPGSSSGATLGLADNPD